MTSQGVIYNSGTDVLVKGMHLSWGDDSSDMKFYSSLVIPQVLLCFSTQRALSSSVESLWGKGHIDTSAHANVIVCGRTTSEEFESHVKMDGERLQLIVVRNLIVFQQLNFRSDCSRLPLRAMWRGW